MKPFFSNFKPPSVPLFLIFLLLGLWSCNGWSDTYSKSDNETPRESRLDQLFKELKQAEDPHKTKVIEARIWEIWMTCEEEEVSRLMKKGVLAMSAGAYEKATDYFTQATKMKPDYAEAWNKRATTRYMMGDLEAALEDIEQTLILEERHFGALSGLAAIYMIAGKERKALRTYEKIARIAPAEPDIQEQIHYLRGKMGMARI